MANPSTPNNKHNNKAGRQVTRTKVKSHEKYLDNNMASPTYYEKHREKLIQYQREYYYENKGHVHEYLKEYYNKHRERLKQRNKEHFRRRFLTKKGIAPSDLTTIAIERNVLLSFE